VLPGKQIQQLNGQTQRLLGQQSLAEYSGMCMDVDAIRSDNNAKQGPETVRKSGLIVNQGGKLSKEGLVALREANLEKYGLSQEEKDAVELPEPPREMKLGADAYMGKNHNKGGIRGGGKRAAPIKRKREADVLTVDLDLLSRPAKLALLGALCKRLIQLQAGDCSAVEVEVAGAAADEGGVLKEKQNAAGTSAAGAAAAAAVKSGGAANGAAAAAAAKKPAAKKARAVGGSKKGASNEAVSGDEDMEEENAAPAAAARARRSSLSPADAAAVSQLVARGGGSTYKPFYLSSETGLPIQ
jgi:hypothetical protein